MDKKEYMKKYYLKNREKILARVKKYKSENKERYNNLSKEWVRKNPEKRSEISKKYNEKNKEKILLKNKEYKKNNKLKVNARNMAERKIELKKSCEICNSTEKLQRHHWNYDKPLVVNTLCGYCHKIQHKISLGGI